jgi:arylsulfatase A-like enzyme
MDSERRALAAFPPAPEGAPNVLLLVLDTVRASALGLYGGDPATSPALSRWAREGVKFEWAMSVAPWTLPSHASMFTGRYAGELSTSWRAPLDQRDSTLAELFETRGYATGGFVGNMHYTSWESGLARGFATFDDYRRSPRQLLRSASYTQTQLYQKLAESRSVSEVARAIRHPSLEVFPRHWYDRKNASQVAEEFLDWQARMGSRPFFAFLNFIDAHSPYTAPAAHRRFPPARAHFHEYQAAISYLDTEIDSILTTLKSRGVLDNTVVIITADHGEQFREHGLLQHGNSLYLDLLRVPLVIRFPGAVPAATQVQQAVSLRDLAATIVDLGRLERARVPGRSLRSTWSGSGDSRVSPVFAQANKTARRQASYPAAPGDMSSLMDDSAHYIRHGMGRAELYAYRADTSEGTDSAASSAAASRVAAWQQRVDSLLRAHHR